MSDDLCPICLSDYEQALSTENPQTADEVDEIYYCCRPAEGDHAWDVYLHR